MLFIDADIVALSACDSIFKHAADVEMGIAPRFLPSLSAKDRARLPPEEVARIYKRSSMQSYQPT
ncbi:MAG: hypothetical protein WBV71_16865, partial [Roseobacter sp.]